MVRQKRPALILLNETHLSAADSVQLLTPPGYKVVVRLDRSRHGGGLLVLAENHRLVDAIDVSHNNTVNKAEMVCVDYMGSRVVLCYTQKSATAGVLFDALEVLRLNTPDKKLLVVGDFNAHNQEWLVSTHTDEAGVRAHAFSEMFSITQLVDSPTRGDNTLDLVYSDTGGSCELCPHFGTSDHLSLYLEIPTTMPCPEPSTRRLVYLWKSAPWNHIRGYLRRELAGWSAHDFDSVDDADRALNKIELDATKRYVKQRVPRRMKPTPWWNQRCQSAFVAKSKAFKSRKSTPGRYTAAKRSCKRAEAAAFKAYQLKVKLKLADSSNSSRDFWSLTKEVAGISRPQSKGAPSVEELAEHFSHKMSIDPVLDAKEFVAADVEVKMKVRKWRVSRERLIKVLSTLNVNKAVNGVSPRFLRECVAEIVDAEISLHKRIVKESLYPTDWKVSRITALHKRDSVSVAANYRPISALPNRSLVFERCLAPQLADFCESITPPDQFGFVRKCGTGDYGAYLSMLLQHTLEQRRSALLVSLDVAGAFDKAWHKALLAKLKKGGLRGRALKLMVSYLILRYLIVVMAGKASKKQPITCSVPQGAIWSPPLWDVTVNDLSQQVECINVNYADDSALCSVFESMEQLMETIKGLNADMESLRDWGVKNNLTFDPKKNKFLVVSKWHEDFSGIDTLEMGGFQCQYAAELQLVGFTFDKSLTWSSMISKLTSKARSKLGALWRLRPVMDEPNLETVFKAYVRSVMEYGDLEYMSAAPTNLAKLDAVQHTAERICGSSFQALSGRREAAAFGMLCKMLDGQVRGGLNDFIPEFDSGQQGRRGRSASAQTGPTLKDMTGPSSLKQYDRSFCGIIPKIFSKLPEEIVQEGMTDGWRKVMKRGQRLLSNAGM
jgi:hypothetical protein